jgi:hypothetical protein
MIHHTLAATGLDEAVLMSWTASEPFMKRVLRPGAAVAPFLTQLLPKRQTFVGAGVYAAFLVLAFFQILMQRVDDKDVRMFTCVFLLACVFDRGVFHSTRPSDILKFLVATLFGDPELNVYVLLACLYFWSGVYKLRGFFHGWVFPYQFLNFSGISWYFRRLYLTRDFLPRSICQLFGALGTLAELMVGLGMLFGPLTGYPVALYSMIIGCGMHLFIFVCGMGPFRWNLMTLYMLCCCIVFQEQQALSVFTLASESTGSVMYLALFGLTIPIIGCVQPTTLGTYFGGYRMATFHFAGNETYRALLIRKDVIPAAHSSRHGDYDEVLRERAEGYERITDDEELWTGMLYSDGADIEVALRKGFHQATRLTTFEEFDASYVYVPITLLNLKGPLLNTKWDESLPVTDRILELVCESVSQGKPGENPRLEPGAVLELVAHVVPWCYGRTKKMELFDLAGSKYSTSRWSEEISLPWSAQNLKLYASPGSIREPLVNA